MLTLFIFFISLGSALASPSDYIIAKAPAMCKGLFEIILIYFHPLFFIVLQAKPVKSLDFIDRIDKPQIPFVVSLGLVQLPPFCESLRYFIMVETCFLLDLGYITISKRHVFIFLLIIS